LSLITIENPMEEVISVISSLQKKTGQLVKLHTDIKLRNKNLVAEVAELRKMVDSQKETIKNLEERNKIIKLAKSLTDSKPDTAEMKYKINELVREIDKCIAQMNS
jgi:hypothetical protein